MATTTVRQIALQSFELVPVKAGSWCGEKEHFTREKF